MRRQFIATLASAVFTAVAWALGFSAVLAAAAPAPDTGAVATDGQQDQELPAEERPVELRCSYPPDGAKDFALGHVDVPRIGEVTLRGTRTGIDLIVTAVTANGASIGHTETLVRLSPLSPLLVPTQQGLALILIRWSKGAQ